YPPPCNDSPPVQRCNDITGSRLNPVRPWSTCVAGPLPLLGEGAQRARPDGGPRWRYPEKLAAVRAASHGGHSRGTRLPRIEPGLCASAMQSIKRFPPKELWKNPWSRWPRPAQSNIVYSQNGPMRKCRRGGETNFPKCNGCNLFRQKSSFP